MRSGESQSAYANHPKVMFQPMIMLQILAQSVDGKGAANQVGEPDHHLFKASDVMDRFQSQ
jgi:hypothetical protein